MSLGNPIINAMRMIDIYYQVKPLVPRRLQISLRRKFATYKLRKAHQVWPINPKTASAPEGWEGWPDKKKFAFVLHHDVDTQAGVGRCERLMKIEKQLGFRSSFNFVPEDYPLPFRLREALIESGFEVGVHGLKHDGKLFKNQARFNKGASRVNRYLKEWNAVGFSSPSMVSNLEWIGDLDIEYDCSSFDTDPFEPQPESAGTIFPFLVMNGSKTRTYVELPYTMPQDHTLYVIFEKKNIDIWVKKLNWLAENGALALVISHPDYINFDAEPCAREQYPLSYYISFLEYVQKHYAGQYWHVLPRELARFWKERMLPKSS